MKYLYLDFETRSLVDIKKAGVYNYATHPSTRVLMLAYAFDDEPIKLWVPHREGMPDGLWAAIKNPDIIKVAWNVSFERLIFKYVRCIDIPISEWLDPSVWAKHLSLPGKLEECGKALGLAVGDQKLKEGKKLIRMFSMPFDLGGEPTLFGVSEPVFHSHISRPAEWTLFEDYCKQDVHSEREIFKLMQASPLPEREQKIWELDQEINERGIPVNREFVIKALEMAQQDKDDMMEDMTELTGDIENVNSRAQILPWLKENGYPYGSLNKNFVKAALASNTLSEKCREVLVLRQDASKTAYTKLETLLEMLSMDDRLRFQFVFLGASRSGRWSGSGVQPQNLPRPIKWVEKRVPELMEIVMNADMTKLDAMRAMEKEPPSVIAIMTSLIRQAFQAPPGKKLVVCDLNAIENRVLGWVCDCDAILQVFKNDRCPYMSFGAQYRNCDYFDIADIKNPKKPKNAQAAEWRQIDKSAVLGAGYGLGSGVKQIPIFANGRLIRYEYKAITKRDDYGNIVKTGLMAYAENMGVSLTPEQAFLVHKAFRESYPELPQGWKKLQDAAVHVITHPDEKVETCKVVFDMIKIGNLPVMRIQLPSGRFLHYINPRVEYVEKEFEFIDKRTKQTRTKTTIVPNIMYDGIGHGVGMVEKGGKWGKTYTYGGKLMENIVQAISRDLLADGMMEARNMGADICLHVHDEICVLADKDDFSFNLEQLELCMKKVPYWAGGLILGAEGYTGAYYKK